jgi:STE24 endopeptidase
MKDTGRQATAAAGRQRSLVGRWLHVLAALVVVVGLAAAFLRPFAPGVGTALDAGRWFDAEYLATAAEYRQPRYVAAALGVALRIGIPCLLAFTAFGRGLVARILARCRHRPVLGAAAVVAIVVVVTDLAVLPLQFWIGYVHDGRYGFRTQGLAGWARDWIVLTVPVWALVTALAAAGWALARRFPKDWPAIGGLAASVLLVVLVVASPLVLEPLEFRTEPLDPGTVRTAVEAVVERSGQPVGEIVVADASRRTTRQNAYVSGLGATRRIVLYDTLVEGQPPAVVAQVVAHELAHDRHGDLGRGTLFAASGIIVAAYGLHGIMAWRTRRGLQRTPTDPQAAGVAVAAVVLLLTASLPLQNWVSRQYEAAADLGALEMTQDPATYLEQRTAVTRANLGDPSPPRWFRYLRSTHPSPVERLEMGEQWPLEWRGPSRP